MVGVASRVELRGASRAADRDLVTRLIGAALVTPDVRLRYARPTYARLKGEDGDLVAYRAVLDTPQGPTSRTVSVRTGPLPRLRAQASRFSDERVTRWTAPLRPWFLDTSRGLLLLAFPLDRALPELRRVLDVKWVRRTLESHGLLDGHAGRMRRSRSVLGVVAYRPERRAVVRLDARFAGEPRVRSLFLRLHAQRDFADASQAALRALTASGASTPRALGQPLPHLAVESACAGTPADEIRLGDRACARAVGELLARVHATPAPPGVPPFRGHEIALAARACARRLAEVHPELAGRALRAADRLGTVTSGEAGRLVHGDLHPGQILFDGEEPSLVDWDRSGAGDPGGDLGSLRARLESGMGSAGEEAFDAVLAGYARVARPPAPDAVRWYEGQALLRLIDGPYRTLASDWVERTARIVKRLERIA